MVGTSSSGAGVGLLGSADCRNFRMDTAAAFRNEARVGAATGRCNGSAAAVNIQRKSSYTGKRMPQLACHFG